MCVRRSIERLRRGTYDIRVSALDSRVRTASSLSLDSLSNEPIAFRSRQVLSRVGHYRHSLYWNRSITSRPNLRQQLPPFFSLSLAESRQVIRIHVKARRHGHTRVQQRHSSSRRYAIEKSPGSCELITMFRNNVLCHAVDCKLFGYKKGIHLRSPPGVMVRSASL